jgi:hypothetical protein
VGAGHAARSLGAVSHRGSWAHLVTEEMKGEGRRGRGAATPLTRWTLPACWVLALVAVGCGWYPRGAEGAANGSSGWSSTEKVLPAGWSMARLDSGEEFYFRLDDPDTIFWEFPLAEAGMGGGGGLGGSALPVPAAGGAGQVGSSTVPGAAKLRNGEIIGVLEICDSGHLIGDEYEGLLVFMRRYGYHFINRHPQAHLRELVYTKTACKKGELEPHIRFVEKEDRSVVVEELSLRGLKASDILAELLARGIDASVRHTEAPVRRQQRRNKWAQRQQQRNDL